MHGALSTECILSILKLHLSTIIDKMYIVTLKHLMLSLRNTMNRDVWKTNVQTLQKRENVLLHTDVSLDMLDKRACLGATGTQKKTPFGSGQVSTDWSSGYLQLHGSIGPVCVCVCEGPGPRKHPEPKIRDERLWNNWQKSLPCLISSQPHPYTTTKGPLMLITTAGQPHALWPLPFNDIIT